MVERASPAFADTAAPAVIARGLQAPTRKITIGGFKARPGAKRAKRWVWKPFTSSARKDGAQFFHWVRADSELLEYPFARYNKKADIVRYTDAEYAELLTPSADRKPEENNHDARWPKEHTDHLFELCRRYDLRWPVIYDRFDLKPSHDLEEMKLRFYTVTTRVIAARLKDTRDVLRMHTVQSLQVRACVRVRPSQAAKTCCRCRSCTTPLRFHRSLLRVWRLGRCRGTRGSCTSPRWNAGAARSWTASSGTPTTHWQRSASSCGSCGRSRRRSSA